MRAWWRLILVMGAGWAGILHATDSPAGFAGVWAGHIRAPDTTTSLGVALIETEKGLLLSLSMPEMFIYNANFGPATIRDGQLEFPPLNLVLRREGEELRGTFAIPKLPVVLQRGSAFPAEPPATTLPPAPPPRWSVSLGAGVWASPIIRDGVVFVGALDGRFHAVSATDGTALWTWTGPTPIHGTALVTEDSIYFVDDANELVRLGRSDGKLRWRFPLRGDTAAPEAKPDATFTHRTAAPVIDERGILYVGSTEGVLHAIRARNGKPVWQVSLGAPIHAAVALHGGMLLAGCFDGSLVALSQRTHREIWRTKLGGPIVSAPAVAGEKVIVGARDYLLYAVNLSDGAVSWRNSFWFSWIESTPVIEEGVAYVGGSDYRRVSALEVASGARRWATDVRGLSWGTPVVTTDVIFAATAGQHVAGTVIQHEGGMVALDRVTGKILWRYEANVPAGAAMSGFTGSLATDGTVVVGASVEGMLIAFPVGR